MIVCPGCIQEQPRGAWPWITMSWEAEAPEPVPWYCKDCLAERIAAAHADDCRCQGCTDMRSDRAWGEVA